MIAVAGHRVPGDGPMSRGDDAVSCVRCLPRALMVAMGCGEKVIDATKVEDAINQDIQETGVAGQVKSVECPEDEPSEDGRRFDCTVIRTDGGTEAIPVVVTDGEAGNVSFGQEAQ